LITVRELITKIGFDLNEAEMKKAERAVDNLKKRIKTGMKIAAAGAVAAIAGIAVASVKAAGDMELITTQFEVMLGSAEKAVGLMKELETFSATTPFQLEDLAKGTENLLAAGVALENVVPTMRMLGDTAGGSRDKLQGLVLGFSKMESTGKASLEVLNIFAERGVPIFAEMQKNLNLTKEQFFKMVSAGKIATSDVKNAFKTMTSEGGLFFQGMVKASSTFNGLLSTLKDNLKLITVSIGQAMLPILKKYSLQLIEVAKRIREWVVLNRDKLEKGIEKTIKVIEKLVKFMIWLGKIIKLLFIDTPIAAIVLGIVAAYKAWTIAITAATIAQALFNKQATIGIGKTALFNKNILKAAKSVATKLGPALLKMLTKVNPAIAIAALGVGTLAMAAKRGREKSPYGTREPTAEELGIKKEPKFSNWRERELDDMVKKQVSNEQKRISVSAPMSISVDASSGGGGIGRTSAGAIGKVVGVAVKAEFSKQMQKILIAAE
jgi:tape measure domain-containing protein